MCTMVTLRDRNKIKPCANQNLTDSKSHGITSLAQSCQKLNREDRLKMAMTVMNDGPGMVYTDAVKLFNVKRSTLHDHMSSKCMKFTKGRYPLLTAVEEQALLEMLKSLHSKGYTITSHICRRAAYMYAELCNYPLTNVSQQQMAGRKWFSGFVQRNNVTIGSIRKPIKTESDHRSRGQSKRKSSKS